MDRLATRSAREALSYHVPRNALYSARLELASATLDLLPPGFLNPLFSLRVEALNQHADELGPVRLLKGQRLPKYVVSRSCHVPILPPDLAEADSRDL